MTLEPNRPHMRISHDMASTCGNVMNVKSPLEIRMENELARRARVTGIQAQILDVPRQSDSRHPKKSADLGWWRAFLKG